MKESVQRGWPGHGGVEGGTALCRYEAGWLRVGRVRYEKTGDWSGQWGKGLSSSRGDRWVGLGDSRRRRYDG